MKTTVPADDFPATIEYIQSIGTSDEQRAAELGFKNSKSVERLRDRFPSTMWPFLRSRHAIPLLTKLLDDLQRP